MSKRSGIQQTSGGESAGARAFRGFERVVRFVQASEWLARAADGARSAGRAPRQVAPGASAASRAQKGDVAEGPSIGALETRVRAQASGNRTTSLDAMRLLSGFAAAAREARMAARLGDRMQVYPALDSARTRRSADKARVRAGTGLASRGLDAARDAGRQATAGVDAVRRSQSSMKGIEQAGSVSGAGRRIEKTAMEGSTNRSGDQEGATRRDARSGSDSLVSANRVLARSQELGAAGNKLSRAVGAVAPGAASRNGIGGRDRSTLAEMAPALNGWARAATVRNSAAVAPARLASPKFADLPARGFDRDSRGGTGALTINSSPTVVVNSGEGRGDIEREVMSALRAHREELFDSLRREAARRERAQF